MTGFLMRELLGSAMMLARGRILPMVIQFPTPATQGFFNVGDAMAIVTTLTVGPVVGAIPGGLSSSLANFMGGLYVWVDSEIRHKYLVIGGR
jgi:uncharacterized membrane protein